MTSGEIYIKVNPKNSVVTEFHHNPFDPTEGLNTPRDELEKEGFFVSSIPKAEIISGRRAVPKYNMDSKEVYYEYIEMPLSQEERLNALEGFINEAIMSGFSIGGDI